MKMVLRAAQGRAARRRHDGRHSETLPKSGKGERFIRLKRQYRGARA